MSKTIVMLVMFVSIIAIGATACSDKAEAVDTGAVERMLYSLDASTVAGTCAVTNLANIKAVTRAGTDNKNDVVVPCEAGVSLKAWENVRLTVTGKTEFGSGSENREYGARVGIVLGF